jgi:hypothetical protein
LAQKSTQHFITISTNFLSSKATVAKYRFSEKDFTRKRKLNFENLALCMIKLLKQNIQVELLSFFKNVSSSVNDKINSITSSAFTQSRKKLKPDLFYDLNALIVNEFFSNNEDAVKLYKGHRLLSIDGSIINLPLSKDTIRAFGTHNNQNKTDDLVLGRVSIMYDLLNEIVIDGILCAINQSEVPLSRKHIALAQENDILIMDRGYPSFESIFEMDQRKIHFIFRCKTSFNTEVAKFALSNKKEELILIKPAAHRSCKGLPYNKSAFVKVRLIKVKLDSGEIEILMTSLKDTQNFPRKDFKKLYFKRWGIETYYNRFKNVIGVEQFSGTSEQFVQQEFNCALYISNLQSILTKDAQQEIDEKYSHRKYEYKVNSSMSLTLIRAKILELFSKKKDSTETLEELKTLFVKNVIPIRPNRKFERNPNKYRQRLKPKQFPNKRLIL